MNIKERSTDHVLLHKPFQLVAEKLEQSSLVEAGLTEQPPNESQAANPQGKVWAWGGVKKGVPPSFGSAAFLSAILGEEAN